MAPAPDVQLAAHSTPLGGKAPYEPGSASGSSNGRDGWDVFAIKEHSVPGAGEALPSLSLRERVSSLQTADGGRISTI